MTLGTATWHEDDIVAAFTVAELGAMLPRTIESKIINAAYPMPEHKEKETDDEWEKVEKAREDMREKLNFVFDDLDASNDDFEDGMRWDISIGYGSGKTVRYRQDHEDWEECYSVIEISGDTEADARAKMLIYLLEHSLITLPQQQ
jgi:hypothetical protein